MNPPSTSSRPPGFKVETILAIVATDEKGEGIPRWRDPAGNYHVLIDANDAMFRELLAGDGAEKLRKKIGPFKVLRFTNPADVTAEYCP